MLPSRKLSEIPTCFGYSLVKQFEDDTARWLLVDGNFELSLHAKKRDGSNERHTLRKRNTNSRKRWP